MHRTGRALAAVATASLCTLGVAGPALAQPAAAGAAGKGAVTSSVTSSQAVSAKASGCGFHQKNYVVPIWKNCTKHNYRVTVSMYNNTSPGSPAITKTICTPPGTTDLNGALGGLGTVYNAHKYNNDSCKNPVHNPS